MHFSFRKLLPPPTDQASARRRGGERGVALVLVLSFLVLTLAVVLIFFSGVTTERTASASYASQVTTQQLAESAVQTVMGTIRQATAPPSASTHIGWASQPGMIRTYGDGAAGLTTAGDLSLADYKLYSSDNSVITADQMPFDPTKEVPGASSATPWWTEPALFTDLNSPVSALDPSTGNAISIYPVVDPTAQSTDGKSGVEGFFINQAPLNAAATAPNPAPMPVKWIYVLSDGTLTAPDQANGNMVQWSAAIPLAKQPTATNPIVGRLSYWTDDETCKVNVNTATEGNDWDEVRSASPQDINYALIQPLQHEYQRYPGHPATTSLSAVFEGLGLPLNYGGALPSPLPFPAAPFGTNASPSDHVDGAMTAAYTSMQPYYAIAPRVVDGGSDAGTAIPVSSPTPIPVKANRLYASVDELLFAAPTPGSNNTGARTVTQGTTAPLNKTQLEQAKFFITATSRAPDVTLFDTPKIACWPEWDDGTDKSKRTAFDELIAFCSSIGNSTNPNEYFFARQNPRSPTADYSLTDSSGRARNQQLYSYLQSLTGAPVPGFGGGNVGFLTKYPQGANATERDQILTNIYDYIRSTNLSDVSAGATPYTPPINNIVADGPTPYNTSLPINRSMLGGGEVIPIQINTTQGFGRAATISEAGLIFYATNPLPNKTTPSNAQLGVIFVASLGTPMQGHTGHVPNISMQVAGLGGMSATIAPNLTVSGLAAAGPLGFANAGTTYSEGSDMATRLGMTEGGFESFEDWFSDYAATKSCSLAGGNALNNYPFFVQSPLAAYKLPAAGSFQFSGGIVTVTLSACQSKAVMQGTQIAQPAGIGPSQLYVPYQTLTLKFPPAALPLPRYNPVYIQNTNSFDASNYSARMANDGAWYDGDLIVAEDTVISLQAAGATIPPDPANATVPTGVDHTGGDYRMYAALRTVPPKYFRPSMRYAALNASSTGYASQSYAFLTAGGNNSSFPSPQVGTLITPNLTTGIDLTQYPPPPAQQFPLKESRNPALPSYVGSYVTRLGSPLNPLAYTGRGGYADWDFGMGCFADGPFINKSDDGNGWNPGTQNDVIPDVEDLWSLDSRYNNCFSPNRQIPSSMMFGSLPTGVQRFMPWQTLLFHATPDDPTHPGNGVAANGSVSTRPAYVQQAPFSTLPDHLIADNFWMPVVEPYAISEPFSTAGKVNMNYQIVPFTYIHRDTGIRAVIKNVSFPAFEPGDYPAYKPELQAGSDLAGRAVGLPNRYTTNLAPATLPTGTVVGDPTTDPNIPPTLREFESRFANKDLFRSATEISTIDFIPTAQQRTPPDSPINSASDMAAFWNAHNLTGTNLRNRPYIDIYPRLTTKSNTYTVHFRVQTLHKRPGGVPTTWTEGSDAILSEYRGSSTIERYIDADNPIFQGSQYDFATTFKNGQTLDNYDGTGKSAYKFRVLTTKRFAP